MLKNAFRYLVGMSVVGLLGVAPAYAFDDGIDYKTLSRPQATETGDKVEVLEIFWYGCPHCYHLEPLVQRWLAQKPDYVEFRRMPGVLGNHWAIHAKAFYAAEMLGVLDRIHEPLFGAINKQKRRLNDEESLADFFAEQGVDREDFLKAMRSFVVDMKVRRAIQFGTRLGIDGVPTFLVNGKYITSPSLTASGERMFRLVDDLVAQEAAVKAAEAQEGAGTQPEPEPKQSGGEGSGSVSEPAPPAAVSVE
jgi:thiol:disulfide interchange protein DsbA